MTVVHRPGKQGLGRAYVDGMTWAIRAGAECVVQMDSDLSHGPEHLPQMLAPPSTGADVVIGSRYVAGASLASEWSWRRKMLSGFANTYVRMLLRLGIGMSQQASSSGVARPWKPSTSPASEATATAFRSR